MTGVEAVRDLTVVLCVGLASALISRRLGLPVVAGYLVAGVVAGPGGLNLVRDLDAVMGMAELGVALLLFTLGVDLSVRSLTRLKSASLVAGPLQLALSVGLGYALGRAWGWDTDSSLILGFALALSSTMVVVKLLGERGELHTNQGRLMIAVLLVQDLAAVLMVGALPVLTGTRAFGADAMAVLLGKGLAFLIAVYVLARLVIPRLFSVVARGYTKEVFVVTAAALCFGGAWGSQLLGFSLALGAFIAGLMISESDYSHEVLADVTPLRDLFAIIFFVSLGLLFEPGAVLRHPGWAISVLAAVVVGKALIVFVAALAAGFHMRSASAAGLGLSQIGEFSFVVATLAYRSGLLTREQLSLVEAVALITLLASPALLAAGDALYQRLRSRRAVEHVPLEAAQDDAAYACGGERPVLICGYGRVGRHVGEMLLQDGAPFAVVDFDQVIVAELRQRGISALYGDAASARVLEAAGAKESCLAVLALPDAMTTRLAIRSLKRISPGLPILARVHPTEEIDAMYREGAEEVVQAEFEASLEMLRHTLLRLGRDPRAAQARTDAVRQQRYLALRRRDAPRDSA
ncbi:MAG: cation:proton antiporter [Armatimonadota bacterium]|nr:MAG: cation:proton antiporter [Armatimonadota bacterium]